MDAPSGPSLTDTRGRGACQIMICTYWYTNHKADGERLGTGPLTAILDPCCLLPIPLPHADGEPEIIATGTPAELIASYHARALHQIDACIAWIEANVPKVQSLPTEPDGRGTV